MFRQRRAAASAALAIGVLAVGVLGFAVPASAHVTVNPREATQGSYARVAFRAPTESDTASTVKIEVNMPEENPIASVSLQPVPGWEATVERRTVDPPIELHGSQVTEVVSKITWTASPEAAVKPGQFQEFPVSMGPLPKAERLVFKALQTYSDGNVVRWIEEPPAEGGEAPEHPAPVLKLAAAPEAGEPSAAASQPAAAAPGAESEDASGNQWTGIAGLIAGLAGLVLGGLALMRTQQLGAASSSTRQPDADA